MSFRKVTVTVGVASGVVALTVRWFNRSIKNAVEGAWQ